MSTFRERLDVAKAEPKERSQIVSVVVGGELAELVFYRADSSEWAEVTSRHPARPKTLIDLRYGYNFHAVCKEIAPSTGRLLENDTETVLDAAAWKDILEVISGSEFAAITDAIWALNEYDPEQRVKQLKKASAGRSETKPA